MKTRIRIEPEQDCDFANPRDFDNLGTMVCWHRNYTLGDRQPKEDPQDCLENLPEGSVVLPLYLYDHSGITMSTGPFSCQFDSGQVGFIYATPDAIKREYSVNTITDETRKKVEELLRLEVKVYDWYLQGYVWWYVVEQEKTTPACDSCNSPEKVEWVDIDSCGGFLGENLEDTGLLGGIPDVSDEQIKEAWENRYEGGY